MASAVQAMKGSASAGIFRLFKTTAPLDEYMERGLVFAGNPDSVYRQIRKMYDHVGGFGHLLIMGQAGFLDHDETVKGMQMFSARSTPGSRSCRAPPDLAVTRHFPDPFREWRELVDAAVGHQPSATGRDGRP